MAEFLLGRIKFVWQGEWTTAKAYVKDDIVRYGGQVYICVQPHTAGVDFYLDNTYWNIMSDGQNWTGDWAVSTYYKKGDIVKYGGLLYVCNNGHTSAATATLGLEQNQGDWDLYAEGTDWKSDWTISTRYKKNDLVKYGGNIYICVTYHTSASTVTADNDGLEADLAKWEIYSNGFDWKNNWTADTRYKPNDLVRYGGQIYVCITGHQSDSTANGLEVDQAKWQYFHRGILYRNDWTSSTRYRVNDLVKYGANIWICTTHHTSTTSLAADEANWEKFVPGLEFEDSWQISVQYQPGDIVTYGGYSYIATTNNVGKAPYSNAGDWDIYLKGYNLRGDWGDDSTNQDYYVGDVVRVGGYTYLCIADHTSAQKPPNTNYWERLNQGFEWQGNWTNLTQYDLGDVVYYGVNSYLVVQAHQSNQSVGGRRPDLDTSGTYYKLLAGGNEQSSLTTDGDLLYYSGSAPTRLPVGDEGTVLAVDSTGMPAWKYWGIIDQVYYVGIGGQDIPAPTWGVTPDRPFKTVRFAAEQIEKGARNPKAANLLVRNRAWIADETVEWIDAQIAGNTAPFTSGFVYDKEKCRRDTGLIVDALVWDITHGGNLETRRATLEYINNASQVYALGQEAETVAALQYAINTLIVGAIFDNPQSAPASTYGTITQYTNSYVAETSAKDEINNLKTMIYTAVASGNTADVPVEARPQRTIFVGTGTYFETLPIRVPADTAVVGDELRSTNIRPAGSLVAPGDSTYTQAALGYLKTIVDDVIGSNAVGAPQQVGVAQYTNNNMAGVVSAGNALTNVKANAVTMYDIVDQGAGALPGSFTMPAPHFATAAQTGAHLMLLANKTFLQEEIGAWLNVNENALWTSLTVDQKNSCKRDTGYIAEALAYDIRYGGNTQSHVVMRSFYSNGTYVKPSNQKSATLAAYAYLKTIVDDIATGVAITPSAGNGESQDVSNTSATATEATAIQDLVQDIYDTIDDFANLPAEVNVNTTAGGTQALIEDHISYTRIANARTQIRTDAVEWVRVNFPTLQFDRTLCSRDVGYIVDAFARDALFGSDMASVVAARSYLRGITSTQLVLAQQKDATLGMLNFLKYRVKYEAAYGSNHAIELMDDIIAYISTGTRPPIAGNFAQTTYENIQRSAQLLYANKDFLAEEAVAYIDATYPAYAGTYDTVAFKRDVREIIDAIYRDLRYTGNYNSVYAARFYYNAVNGSIQEDMYYLRNGTGLRNCTVQGLTGTLSVANAYGTSRPTAGAFVSLDPGWGPNDSRVWITGRSPYVQNVTTFGTACVGLKVDGVLHNGGNDSIVANDFTQVLSDGIGAWVTNLGRSELVSVFSYYGHIGYLAENGGKIRATNGNSSYGTYGTVSEGVDPTEVPVTGTVNNRNRDAQIQNVITNQSQILRVEYANAGVHYTNATFDFAGDGSGAIAYADEFRDKAVFDVRMLNDDINYDDVGDFGGQDYSAVNNTAQSGDASNIVISNTDTGSTGQYNGMRIVITSGLGVGQYGYIGTYLAGSKAATVFRESDGQAGWDHLIPGTAISPLLDGTTKYEIEPRITVSHPGYSDTQQSVGASLQYEKTSWGYAGGRIIAAGKNVAVTVKSDNGTTWSAGGNLSGNADWRGIAGDGDGNWVALVYGSANTNYSTDNGASWQTGSIGVSANWEHCIWSESRQRFVAMSGDGDEVAYSADGITWTNGTLPVSRTWTALIYGRNEYLAMALDGTGVKSTDGITWNQFGFPTPSTTYALYHDITWGNGRYVVTLDRGDKYYWSQTGTTWTEATYPSYMTHQGFIDYGMGVFAWNQVKKGQIKTITNIGAADAGRTPGTYNVVTTTGSNAGVDAEFEVEVDVLGACAITVTGPGKLYAVAETLTIAAADIGGTGTDITFDVDTVTSGNEGATSPDGINWTQRTNSGLSNPTEFVAQIFAPANNTPQWFRVQTSTVNQNRIVTGAQAFLRARVATGKIASMKILEPGSGYSSVPTLTITDPSNTIEAPFEVRIGNGALGQPTMMNRGIGYETATATVSGDGYQDAYQPGSNIYIEGLSGSPLAGSNVTFEGIISTTYPYAYTLLTDNKEYLKDEVIAWINAQVTAGTGIWSGFTYDAVKCERDTGYIIDAIAHDIKFGGNIESLKAAKSYWNGGTSRIPGEQDQSVAALNQLKTIITDYILTNTSYSSLQSPVVTTQTTNSNNGENGTVARTTYLIGIMTDVIANGLSVAPAEKAINNPYFKLVTVRELLGSGPYTARIQVSPDIPVNEAPAHGDVVELRIRYSQVRLTGHDFLDIGTGNFTNTNYPNLPLVDPDATKETYQAGGGRVFYTSTDQDGNFRVGELFSVEQSTGVATLNADAFNIAGLNELSLGSVELGGTGAVITEFSTDGTFAANSDSVVPTQRAIRTYINSQIGGGNSELNVNIMTAGVIEIKEDQIDTTTGVEIKVKAKMNFLGGVDGDIVALQRMLLS